MYESLHCLVHASYGAVDGVLLEALVIIKPIEIAAQIVVDF